MSNPLPTSSLPCLGRKPITHNTAFQGSAPTRFYCDRDADLNIIKSRKVTIVGYGSQGHAHVLNLRDSGITDVVVALRPGSPSVRKAEGEGLKVMNVADASKWADVIMMLVPDELQTDIYKEHIEPNIRDGAALAFAHGLNIHFNLIEPKASVDVIMIAPKGTRPHRAWRMSEGWRRALPDRCASGSIGQCP